MRRQARSPRFPHSLRFLRAFMRQASVFGIGLLMAASLLAITAAAFAVAQQEQPSQPISPAASPNYGLPGIRPHRDSQGRALAVGPGGATFTEADVRAWWARGGDYYRTVDGKAPTIAVVRFLLAAQVSAQYEGGDMEGLATDLQCVLVLHGNFDMNHLPTGGPSVDPVRLATVVAMGRANRVAHSEVIVFDAHTGNMLTNGLTDVTFLPGNPLTPSPSSAP